METLGEETTVTHRSPLAAQVSLKQSELNSLRICVVGAADPGPLDPNCWFWSRVLAQHLGGCFYLRRAEKHRMYSVIQRPSDGAGEHWILSRSADWARRSAAL